MEDPTHRQGRLDPGPYLLGTKFCAIDIFLWMLIEWHLDPARLFEKALRLQQLSVRVHARPAIARICPEHEEDRPAPDLT